MSSLLVVGATGSIGRLVVDEALRGGYAVRALVRSEGRTRALPAQADRVFPSSAAVRGAYDLMG